ncbi:MAG TPA: DNA mismatch repair endonuclease MutL [Syntrophales bacterium]|nr:DNA mismatch repair endonuclease MutL [Syntrophobacterales bacterium]HQL89070.1 DNA mismatch repair endonuclease MutL [Syntrophales bacterium]
MKSDRGITVLPEEVASKIAAGEVIERPSSVVKELLENAVDAGATEIAIDLRGGGKERIRVADNGSGIPPQEVAVAFERHATSKILTVEDLYGVRSFGFRGEALPSIAAVARVEMSTRCRGDVEGTRIVVENGRILEHESVGCPEGTTIVVSRLFDALPVRKKFLRQEATEQGHCLDIIVRVLLPHGHVRAKVTAGDRTLLEVPRTENPRDRIVLLLGSDLRNHLVAVEADGPGMRLSGFVSRADFTRSSTRSMFFCVNGRYVRDALLSQAVMSAYRHLLEARKYPACALFVEMPPEAIDVNVHPAKLEVRFRRPQDVRDLIHRGLAEALAGVRPQAGAQTGFAAPGRLAAPGRTGVAEALRRYSLSAGITAPRPSPTLEDVPDHGPGPGGLFAQEEAPRRPLAFTSLDYLGQLDGTYLVFAAPGVLVLLDQHAAHERILFEKLRASKAAGLDVQSLLIPEILEMSPGDFQRLAASRDLLLEAGVEVDPFGENTAVVKSVPALLGDTDVRALVREILDGISDTGLPQDEKRNRIFVRMACRGAIKANRPLGEEEVRRLCRDLDSIPFASNCPHGRPVFVEVPSAAIERMFKRT